MDNGMLDHKNLLHLYFSPLSFFLPLSAFSITAHLHQKGDFLCGKVHVIQTPEKFEWVYTVEKMDA